MVGKKSTWQQIKPSLIQRTLWHKNLAQDELIYAHHSLQYTWKTENGARGRGSLTLASALFGNWPLCNSGTLISQNSPLWGTKGCLCHIYFCPRLLIWWLFFLDTEHKMWVADDPAASGKWAGKEKRVTRSTGGIGCIRWQLSNCVKDRVCFRVLSFHPNVC